MHDMLSPGAPRTDRGLREDDPGYVSKAIAPVASSVDVATSLVGLVAFGVAEVTQAIGSRDPR
ncbi:hypothetical protein [Streptomyces abyssomicinicus]|uniref:hypothetical protein n=1 Tax=Streptomyces abyssomicinicus TaxID=574929 RepID=UPI001250CA41|nr:hypothetical protein [Streptomyces abyssomicinicus]